MPATERPIDIGKLGIAAKEAGGDPTLTHDEAVTLIRPHITLEALRTGDYDDDLWGLWRAETSRAGSDATNEDILERVLIRIREGE